MAGTRTMASEEKAGRSRGQGEGPPPVSHAGKATGEGGQAARARYERKHVFAAAIEQIAESVIITDRSGVIEYVNPAFERMSGYTWKDAVGKRASLLKSGRHGEAFYRDLWGTISRGDRWKGRITNKRKDGSLYEADMCISPVRDEAGAVVNYVAIKRDIVPQPFTESPSPVAITLAHDFNNLAAAIIGFTDLIIDEIPEGTKARRRLGYVRDAGLRAKELVKELVKLSRATEGTAP